jgi:hypothetical protein
MELMYGFREAAGESWTSRDPWWNGNPPVRLRLKNQEGLRGSTQGNAGEEAEDSELTSGSITSLTDNQFWGRAGQTAGQWRMVQNDESRALDTTGMKYGSALRFESNPEYQVTRDPITWGFTFQSYWVFMTTFPMPAHGSQHRPD